MPTTPRLDRPPVRRAFSILDGLRMLGLSALLAGLCQAQPADDLLRRVPPGAGLTVVVEDLREHAEDWLRSPLAADLGRLSEQGGWPGDETLHRLAIARREIEIALNIDLATIRDALLGDAVVLSMHLEPGASPEEAQGLLLVQARDLDLLRRLVERLNAAERVAGQLESLEDREHSGQPYTARQFLGDHRRPEFYTILDDGAFAWSNSESLIQGVIDRSGDGPSGLGDEPAFQAVRRALPERSVVSLFVDPGFVRKVLEADPGTPPEADLPPLLVNYLRAIRYAGLALEWRDGPVLHLHEAIDTDRLSEPLRTLSTTSGDLSALVDRIPTTALALAVGHLDLAPLYDVTLMLMSEADSTRAELLETLLRGLLLGRDPRSEILPRLGPGLVGFIDAPGPDDPITQPPMVLALPVEESTVTEALDNAFRTVLAIYALESKGGKGLGLPRLESTDLPGGGRLTALVLDENARGPAFAYAIGEGLLVLGTSAETVAGYLASNEEEVGESAFRRTRERSFPEAESFAFIDLKTVHQLASDHREALARTLADRRGEDDETSARVDLDRVLAFAGLFRAAFATSTIANDFTSAHRTLGLIVRDRAELPNP